MSEQSKADLVREKIKRAIANGELLRREREARIKAETDRLRKQKEEAEQRQRDEADTWVLMVLPSLIQEAVASGATRVHLGDNARDKADACERAGLRVSMELFSNELVSYQRYYVHWD